MSAFVDCCYCCRYYHQTTFPFYAHLWHPCMWTPSSLHFRVFFSRLAHFASPPPPPPPAAYSSSPINYSQQCPRSLASSYINSNNNNNILDVQSLYTSLPLHSFSTHNQYLFSSAKPLPHVSHTPSTTSSLSSFDDPPPVKPRLSLRPQLPPPPPPPSFVPTFSSSVPQWRGPTRPAPKPPVQIKSEHQQASA